MEKRTDPLGYHVPIASTQNEKDKSLKRISDKFQFFFKLIFSNNVVSNTKSFFSLSWRFLNFSYVFKLALKVH